VTPWTSNRRAASGEISGLGADSKCAVAEPSTTGRPSTHLMLVGLGVRSACMRKPRSITPPGDSFRLRRPRAVAKTASAGNPDALELSAQPVEHLVHVHV